VFFTTLDTLNEQKVTPVILAICVIVARFSALVTDGDHIRGNAFTESLVKDEILPDKKVFQPFFPYLARVLNDTAVELKNVLETAVFHPRTCFFTADASGAVHQELFVF